MERVMYNTILGALPLQPDGRTFYYADCNFDGHKVYSKNRWPCCSGTYPQIAADYRISAYFRDPQGVYVNLYIPGSLQWKQGKASVKLTQATAYPYDSQIQLKVNTSRRAGFALRLRIPAWAAGASISVNGKRIVTPVTPGTFATIQREWKSGDRVELELPLALRLEPVNDQHPDVAALLSGPLVLLALNDSAPSLTRAQILATKKVSAARWQSETASTPITLLPFTSINNERYSTYLQLS
jgi:hypothetical protein